MSRAKTKALDTAELPELGGAITEADQVESTGAASSPVEEVVSAKTSVVHRVRAADYFFDARLGRDFHVGQEVVGWDEERVREYAKRGLVVIDTVVGPTEFK